jgi:GNAT superfamily N-acetyltransferase
MYISPTIDVAEHEPVRARCTLLDECRIEAGSGPDYQGLAPYHYRDTGFPPAVHQIYRAVHQPSRRVVGVIVYAASALNLGIRNKIFGDRYRIGGDGKNEERSRLLNQEMELIIRIVIHPTFRGTGLGQRLIGETLPLRPFRFVEMSAAMGSINPFAEKAGMQAIPVPRPENTERALAALRAVGVTEEQAGNPSEIMRALAALPEERRKFVEAEMHRYALRWIKSRSNREVVITTEIAAKRIAANALLRTMYYLWENPNWRKPQGSSHAEVR